MTDYARDLIIPRLKTMETIYNIRFSKAAVSEVWAIGAQEGMDYTARDQIVSGKRDGQIGPATGFWQFELGGGVKGVMNHPASSKIARKCCDEFGVDFIASEVWKSFVLPENDGLACSFARLLLFTDPLPLPLALAQNEEMAFQYYLRNWRPGAWFNSAPDSVKRHEIRRRWNVRWTKAIAIQV